MAATLEHCILEIRAIQEHARKGKRSECDSSAMADDRDADAERLDVSKGA